MPQVESKNRMSLDEEYLLRLSTFTDHELYIEAKGLFVLEYLRGRQLRKLDICLDFCSKRRKIISEYARNDSHYITNSLEDYMKALHVVDVKRLDLMNENEINHLLHKIGASTVFPQQFDLFQGTTTFLDLIGISKDRVAVCNVAGASMEEKIEEGDLLFIDLKEIPKSGKIVVVDYDNNLLVKRLNWENGKISLLSDNPAFEPIEISSELNLRIFGVVKRILKSADY